MIAYITFVTNSDDFSFNKRIGFKEEKENFWMLILTGFRNKRLKDTYASPCYSKLTMLHFHED